MGGALNKKELDPLVFQCISGRIVNVFCKTDLVLKYLLKVLQFDNQPIGVKKLEINFA